MRTKYRVGSQLGTTIYRMEATQPCAWVPSDRSLAELIVMLLNGTYSSTSEEDVANLKAINLKLMTAARDEAQQNYAEMMKLLWIAAARVKTLEDQIERMKADEIDLRQREAKG